MHNNHIFVTQCDSKCWKDLKKELKMSGVSIFFSRKNKHVGAPTASNFCVGIGHKLLLVDNPPPPLLMGGSDKKI